MDLSEALASFGILFVMELGDKTQLVVLSLTARTKQTVAVFAGASLALTAVTSIGVGIGVVAGELIPMTWLLRLAGAAFVAIGGFLFWSSRHGPPSIDEEEEGADFRSRRRGHIGTLSLTFGLLFIAEMGDKSQLAVISMAAKSSNPLSVFAGASLALVLLTLLAVSVGSMVIRLIPAHWVSRGAAVLFISVGLLILGGYY